jgi:hypothetical protein
MESSDPRRRGRVLGKHRQQSVKFLRDGGERVEKRVQGGVVAVEDSFGGYLVDRSAPLG